MANTSETNNIPETKNNKDNYNSSSSSSNCFDNVPNYADNIPKEINEVLTSNHHPPSINYGLSSNIFQQQQQQQHPYYLQSMGYPLYNNHSHNNNFVWNNPYSRYNRYPKEIPIDIVSKLAEDKLKPTFKSIEMILETFNSINMILESTYSTLYGSFRTMTGVADHLIFIRNHLAELALIPRLTNFLLNFIRWMFKLLGLSNTKLNQLLMKRDEDIWIEASETIKNTLINERDNKKSSLWPVVVFFSVVLGTPYIVWRLLGTNLPDLPDWTLKNGKHFVAIGLYDFKARNQQELSFRKGQMLFIKPESLHPDSKWLVACTVSGQQIGVIPLNFVKLIINK